MGGHRGDYLGVNYAGFAPLFVESVKYLDGVVSRHERELDAMRVRIQVKVDSIKRPRTPRNHDTASTTIFKARVRCYIYIYIRSTYGAVWRATRYRTFRARVRKYVALSQ